MEHATFVCYQQKQQDMGMHALRHTEKRSRNHCCRGKVIGIRYFEPEFVDLVIQHAKRKSLIILSSLACLTVPFFPNYTTSCKQWHTT